LGEKPNEYKNLFKYFTVIDVDWNTGKYLPKVDKPDILVSFSMGVDFLIYYSLKKSVDKLIICSPTPGTETLSGLKVNEIIFLVGEKEKWVLEDLNRLVKTIKCSYKIIVIKDADHKIKGLYLKTLISLIDC
jgi:predicted Zn-ribbon and HTH transcriptional regulator